MDRRLMLLSGPRGAGKSTLLLKALQSPKARGVDIGGIVSLPVEVNGTKLAIDGHDLRSGETRRLAVLNRGQQGSLDTRQWSFDPNAMLWADGVLAAACPCDLLVVDELGVLEFQRGQGWQSGLKAIDEGSYELGLAVIRPELLDQALTRWPHSRVLEIDPADRDAALQALMLLFDRYP